MLSAEFLTRASDGVGLVGALMAGVPYLRGQPERDALDLRTGARAEQPQMKAVLENEREDALKAVLLGSKRDRKFGMLGLWGIALAFGLKIASWAI